MHVIFRESHGLDEAATPTDLGQSPADLVVLSFSDSDLGAFAAGWRAADGRLPPLRLASLAALKHPLSVDTYIGNTLCGAKGVLIRLIGGAPYWAYGLQQVQALAQQKGIALLLGILVAFVGFTSFFRYVDYTETRIIDRSIFFTREATYMDVLEVHASTYQEGENNRLNYHYKLQNGRSYDVKVSESNMEAVKKIDGKIRSTTKRSIDNFAILEMERLGMYSKDEALNLFIIE